jgi:hypothetical protein
VTLRVTLRPAGRGNWRPLVLDVVNFPREQGYLFRKDDSELDIVKKRETWVIDGRDWRVAKVEERKR